MTASLKLLLSFLPIAQSTGRVPPFRPSSNCNFFSSNLMVYVFFFPFIPFHATPIQQLSSAFTWAGTTAGRGQSAASTQAYGLSFLCPFPRFLPPPPFSLFKPSNCLEQTLRLTVFFFLFLRVADLQPRLSHQFLPFLFSFFFLILGSKGVKHKIEPSSQNSCGPIHLLNRFFFFS